MESGPAFEPVPLMVNADGVICIAGTRVTLDTLVASFDAGSTPEEIVQQFPTLGLVDVYAVITYYLHHRAEVQAYLERRERSAARVREEVMARNDQSGIRTRLLARRR